MLACRGEPCQKKMAPPSNRAISCVQQRSDCHDALVCSSMRRVQGIAHDPARPCWGNHRKTMLQGRDNAERAKTSRLFAHAGFNLWDFARGRKMVGAIGFEPTTPSPPAKCATRLRYAPTCGLYSDIVIALQYFKALGPQIILRHSSIFSNLLCSALCLSVKREKARDCNHGPSGIGIVSRL